MRHVRMVALCLVAVFAVAAVVASSASAKGPEWGQCYAKTGGKYTEKNCQTKAKKGKGEYEWRKGPEIKTENRSFEGTGGHGVLSTVEHECIGYSEVGTENPVVYGPKAYTRAPYTPHPCSEVTNIKGEKVFEEEEAGEIFIECTSEHAEGELSGKDDVKDITVHFHGCTVFGPGGPFCTSSGAAEEGEVVTSKLKGVLGFIKKANDEVGVELNPEKKHGEFANFTCAGILHTVVGVGSKKEGAFYQPEAKGGGDGIISPVTPVNKMTPEVTQVYTTEITGQGTPAGKAENVYNKFEGKPLQALEDYIENKENGDTTKWSPAGEEVTNVNKQAGGAEIEIKA